MILVDTNKHSNSNNYNDKQITKRPYEDKIRRNTPRNQIPETAKGRRREPMGRRGLGRRANTRHGEEGQGGSRGGSTRSAPRSRQPATRLRETQQPVLLICKVNKEDPHHGHEPRSFLWAGRKEGNGRPEEQYSTLP